MQVKTETPPSGGVFSGKSQHETLRDDATMLLRLEVFDGLPFIHVVFRKKFSGMRESLQKEFPAILAILRERGYPRVYALNKCDDEKHFRFVQSFGFDKMHERRGYNVMVRNV